MMISHDLHHNVTTLTPNLYGWWWWLLSTFIHGKSPCLISGSVTNWAKKVGLVGFKKLLMCRIHIIDDLMKIQSREAVGLPMKCTKMDQNGQEWSEIAWQCRSFSNFSWVTNFIYFLDLMGTWKEIVFRIGHGGVMGLQMRWTKMLQNAQKCTIMVNKPWQSKVFGIWLSDLCGHFFYSYYHFQGPIKPRKRSCWSLRTNLKNFCSVMLFWPLWSILVHFGAFHGGPHIPSVLNFLQVIKEMYPMN